ncbi:MAG: glycogen synthase GlgA [Candidatus Promineifilaceae bacterium]
MDRSLQVLFISAEVAPFAKRGGLGDVAGALPKALRALGHDVRVVMPAYANIEAGYPGVNGTDIILQVPTGSGPVRAGVFEGALPGSDVPVYFIAERNLFNRPEVYGYWDDPYRFAFLSRAALDLVAALNWRPDLLHAHDWHAAPAVTWLATSGQTFDFFRGIPSLFTIHNLAHQGLTSWNIFDYLGIRTHSLLEERYGEVNFMARGIYHATQINTVSPSYAREILSREGGANMDGLLRHRQRDLHGILNGIDTDVWNPATDKHLSFPYDQHNLAGKAQNKRALQRLLGLPERDDVPLLAMVSRLDFQKGLDILGEPLHLLLNGMAGEAQFVVLGTGAAEYEDMFRHLAHYHKEKMTAVLAYSGGLAPQIYAGSDMFLMPSRFEPCGLGQMIAMRYGSVPIVRATGGLADTVSEGHTGFLFYPMDSYALWQAIQRAMYIYYHDKTSWRQMQINGMSSDFSWTRFAQSYQQLYEWTTR